MGAVSLPTSRRRDASGGQSRAAAAPPTGSKSAPRPLTARRSGWWKWALSIFVAVALGAGVAYGWTKSGTNVDHPSHERQRSDNASDDRAGGSESISGRSSNGDSENSSGGSRAAGRLPVKVAHPKKGGLARTTTQPGVLHAFEYADLFSKASGYLTFQVVDIGDTVERGQTLAEVYDPERQQEAEEAAAAVEEAKAQAQQAEARVTAGQAAVTAAKAMLTQRKAEVARYTANREYREKEYVRYIDLTQQRAVDFRVSDEKQKEYEASLGAEKEANAAVATAEAELAEKIADVVTLKATVASAWANVRSLEARERRANIMVEYLTITSPYQGVVTRRFYHRGAFVRAAGQTSDTPLLSVARTDRMRVVVYLRDRDVAYLDRGDEAVIRIDALDGEEFHGTIARYSEYLDPANRTMRAEIDLDNPTGRLREGMYGAVTILLERPSDHLTIPSGALAQRSEGGEGIVFVVHGHRADKTTVRVGRDNGLRAEILEGLSSDDAVVVSYSGSLEDGEPVDADRIDEDSGQRGA